MTNYDQKSSSQGQNQQRDKEGQFKSGQNQQRDKKPGSSSSSGSSSSDKR